MTVPEPNNPFGANRETYAKKLSPYDVALAAIMSPDVPRVSTCLYSAVTDQGVLAPWPIFRACHSRIKHAPYKLDTILNVTQNALVGDEYIGPRVEPTPENVKAGTAWFAWMFGPQSPWRSITKGVRQSPEEIWKYGFILTGCRAMPKNLFYNLMIASRFATEAPAECLRWYELVYNHGIHPALAWTQIYLPGGGLQPFNSQHMAFDVPFHFDEGIVNMANGTPANLSEAYTPTNVVWAGATPLRQQWQATYPELFTAREVQEKENRWAVARTSSPTLTNPDNIVPLLLAEQERLGLESYQIPV